MRITTSEMTVTLDRINRKLDIVEEKINKLEDTPSGNYPKRNTHKKDTHKKLREHH